MRSAKPVLFGTLIAAITAAAAIHVYSRNSGSSSAALLGYTDTKTVTAGETIYKIQCASRHGVKLEGEPDWQRPNADTTMPAPPHNERGHTWHHTDQLLFDLTKYGVEKIVKMENYKSNMPAYENVLSDDEIIAVLSYIKSTWPEEIQAKHNQLNAQKRKVKK